MNVLVLDPGRNSIKYDFSGGGISATIENYRETKEIIDVIAEIRRRILNVAAEISVFPDAIALRVIYGGEKFRGPVLFSDDILPSLKELVPRFPLHMPAVIELAAACREIFTGVPIVLIFETAFFTNLPSREFSYAINPDILSNRKIRKFGYHGLCHEAAAIYAGKLMRQKAADRPARVVSICLEPRPEVSAVLGLRPVTVTSGTTPLEGLFGDTTSGDIDPGIIIQIAQSLHMGLEEINNTLTGESGIAGLVETGKTLQDIFLTDNKVNIEAREMFLYKLLLFCGSGMAAIGPVDYIIFSGRYKDIGKFIGPRLVSKLNTGILKNNGFQTCWETLPQNLVDIITEDTALFLIESKNAESID